MKKNWLLTTLLATVTIAMGTTTTAFASPPTDITPEHPGGVTAPHSPDGIPSNIEGPSTPSWTSAIRFAMKNPGAKVPGTNDFACKPRKGTHPVVLIPGTSEDAFITWSYYGPRLKAAGFCAYTFNYNPETHPLVEAAETSGNIYSTAAFMAHFVDRVLKATGAQKVNLVGHSQGGGPLPRAYIKYYGAPRKSSSRRFGSFQQGNTHARPGEVPQCQWKSAQHYFQCRSAVSQSGIPAPTVARLHISQGTQRGWNDRPRHHIHRHRHPVRQPSISVD